MLADIHVIHRVRALCQCHPPFLSPPLPHPRRRTNRIILATDQLHFRLQLRFLEGTTFAPPALFAFLTFRKKLCAICPLVSCPAARSDASPNKVPMAGSKTTPCLPLFFMPRNVMAVSIPEEGVEPPGEDGLPPLQRGAPRRREGLPHRPAPLQLLQGGTLKGGEHGAFSLPPHPGFLFHLFNFCHCHWYSCSPVQMLSLSLQIY